MKRLHAGWMVLLSLPLLGFALNGDTQEADSTTWSELTSNDGTYLVRWRSEPALVEFGDRFKIEVEARRADGEPLQATLALDARMPEHGHGMNREPLVKSLEGGHFEGDNMLFHMPGYWEIYFDLTRGAITERTQVPVDID